MDHEQRDPGNPETWLARSRSNLERARIDAGLEYVYLEDLCFDAQQAAEKAIKAVLIHHKLTFPYIHDLRKLLDLLLTHGVNIPDEVKEAAYLTEYATAGRYPGLDEPVTKEEWLKAIQISETVYRWAEKVIHGSE
jgi:HEPN domain-containing protein